MNVLSLFDGLSGAMVALNEVGAKVNKYFASEIDKYAESVSKRHFPDIIRLGDITKIHGGYLPKIDLVIGGSPCQGFSLAGHRLNFDDPRSKLFFDYVRLLEIVNPKYFIMENVPMNKTISRAISERLGVDYVMINSALVTAQSRKRLYWANFSISQPKDRGILLKDVIESGEVDRDKSYCIDTSYYKGTSPDIYFTRKRRQAVFENNELVRLGIINKGGQGQRIYSTNGKSCTLSAFGGGQGAKTGLYAIAQRGRYDEEGKVRQQFESTFKEKSNALTSVQKDSMLLDLQEGKYVIRKLTPVECERLQGLEDNFTAYGENEEKISKSQRYRMIGNGFTIPVISHILREMLRSDKETTLLKQGNII